METTSKFSTRYWEGLLRASSEGNFPVDFNFSIFTFSFSFFIFISSISFLHFHLHFHFFFYIVLECRLSLGMSVVFLCSQAFQM